MVLGVCVCCVRCIGSEGIGDGSVGTSDRFVLLCGVGGREVGYSLSVELLE